MMHRGLARLAVAASAVMVGAFVAAGPAVAEPTTDPQPTEPAVAQLKLPDGGLLATDFDTKGCEGIPGGAKAGTDGWVFNQPVPGVADDNYGYIVGLVISGTPTPVVLGIDKQGVIAFDATEMQSLKAGALSKDKAKAKAFAKATVDEEPSDIPTVPVPAGVKGGLTADGLGWLQTPADWQLVVGFLVYGPDVKDVPAAFTLARVCAPAPAANPSPSKAPGAGGGEGSLPVTGANVPVVIGIAVLLIAVGAGLFLMRRRSTKFVA